MPWAQAKLIKPLRKLRKLLEGNFDDFSPKETHDIRTHCRCIEAMLSAVRDDHKGDRESLLEDIAPIRKAAGKVRDMDVLTSLAAMLASKSSEDESLVQLLEHLGARRIRGSQKLSGLIKDDHSSLSKRLKRYASWIEEQRHNSNTDTARTVAIGKDTGAQILQLTASINSWPKLQAKNLHAFRLQVKELRYLVQLGDESDPTLLKALGRTKDAIGEWHDWIELESITAKVLGRNGTGLIKRIHATAETKFAQALSSATELRKRYFNLSAQHKTGKKNNKSHNRIESAAISAARMVA